MSAEFRVKIGVKNNCLLESIERRGYRVGPAFAKICGISYTTLFGLAAMRISPLGKDGNWRHQVVKLADFLGTMPEELFYDVHIEPLQQSQVERRVNAEEMFTLLEQAPETDPVALLENKERIEVMSKMLETLPNNCREVLIARSEGKTFNEIAQDRGLSIERVRQIEAKGLRHMRHPTRSEVLKDI